VNTRRACLVAITSASLLATASVGAAARDATASVQPPTERVLFVGNSHTGWHGGLDWLIENFVAAEAAPRAFDGVAMTEGGVTLEYHWNNGARQAIQEGGYDTVVLQGYLPGAATRTAEPFLQHARLLHDEAIGTGAETVFFMTWPRGFNDWSDLDDVMTAHRTLEAELGTTVAPAAYAFELAEAARPELQLIGDDRVHATWEGAYLAAATVYATLFDRSPEGLPFDFGVSAEDAAFLQRIAWQALNDWRAGAAVPESAQA
jgi:hypothetical protein